VLRGVGGEADGPELAAGRSAACLGPAHFATTGGSPREGPRHAAPCRRPPTGRHRGALLGPEIDAPQELHRLDGGAVVGRDARGDGDIRAGRRGAGGRVVGAATEGEGGGGGQVTGRRCAVGQVGRRSSPKARCPAQPTPGRRPRPPPVDEGPRRQRLGVGRARRGGREKRERATRRRRRRGAGQPERHAGALAGGRGTGRRGRSGVSSGPKQRAGARPCSAPASTNTAPAPPSPRGHARNHVVARGAGDASVGRDKRQRLALLAELQARQRQQARAAGALRDGRLGRVDCGGREGGVSRGSAASVPVGEGFA
jgi:hypothetical protein